MACAPSDEPLSVVDPQRWRVSEDPSPFPAAPDDVRCDPLGFSFEVYGPEPSLQVWTDACPWITVEQPLLMDLRGGERLAFRLWHEPLTAPEASEAWIGLALGDSLIEWWRRPIPSPAGPVLGEWRLARRWDAGEPVRFHVHNHGSNTYHLLELSVRSGR